MYLHSRNERGSGNAYYILLLIILVVVMFFLMCDFNLLPGGVCLSVESVIDKISRQINDWLSIKY
ncbi:MAG TPA: hypothetical protein P5267_03615 [Patescibacteria group bacterium]|nr:hypothetical protein [Patescibacteria group bacterium]